MSHHLHHHHFTPKILQYTRIKTISQPAATTNHVTGVPCRSKETGTRDNSPVSAHYLQNMPLTGHYNMRQIFSFLPFLQELTNGISFPTFSEKPSDGEMKIE